MDRERYAAVKRDLARRDRPTVQHDADAKSEVVADILTRAPGGQDGAERS